MMKKIINPNKESWEQLTARPTINYNQLDGIVKKIFADVRNLGDVALTKHTENYDKVSITNFRIDSKIIIDAENKISKKLIEAIRTARRNIEKFHLSQKLKVEVIETSDGVKCWQESRPIEKVGLYVPGGSAPLFSTVLMLGIPAVIAGCKEIVLCTPPNQNGEIDPAILFTAKMIGIKKIFSVGGIQAIAAMTFGTETIPKVYKIFGPGNSYVTAAKHAALNLGTSVDMPAGPSELLVLADKTAKVEFIAADLLSQAEHGKDSQVVCIVTDLALTDVIENEVKIQLSHIQRKNIAAVSLANSKIIYFKMKQDIIDFINIYAPEHLVVSVSQEDENFYLQNLNNAGSVFIGNFSPESAGDYASGTNHTLPTNGAAKTYSGINLDSFTKKISFQKISKQGICNIGSAIEIMAEAEGLQAHKNAVTIRLENIKNETN